MIETINLTKKFGSFPAVVNLNLKVKKGEIFGFVGPNGAGKTTTIKMLAGILYPTQGVIKIGGIDMRKNPFEAKKLIGYIPDIPYIYPYMTGREFLHFVAHIYGVKNRQKKINQLLNIFPISELIDGYFKDFSRGTKQKLAILAAILHSPRVLLIDEPLLGLDPQSSQITLNLLDDFRQDGGTIFISSHNLFLIQKICQKLGIIDRGRLIFEGTLVELQKKLKSKQKPLEELFLKITNES